MSLLAASLGVLIAVLAAAFGGLWVGLGGRGGGLDASTSSSSQTSPGGHVAPCPVVGAGAVAGWLWTCASRLDPPSTSSSVISSPPSATPRKTPSIGSTARDRSVAWNAGAETIYGYTAEEAQGRQFAELVAHEDADGATLAPVSKRSAAATAREPRRLHRRKDGATAPSA